jgi:hypothetical protein
VSELLDWAEKAAIENLRGRRENAEHLLKEGATSFTILIAAATGALAHVVKGIESHQTLARLRFCGVRRISIPSLCLLSVARFAGRESARAL